MSYEITGNRHMGACMKKKQAYLNEWKLKSRRKVIPGFPIEEVFKTRKDIDDYLNADRLTCLLCGKTYKSLCAHLLVHGTNADDYKEKYGLPFGAGLTCVSTKAMNVKHGKRLVSDGIFKPMTKERYKEVMNNRATNRQKPAYAIQDGILRVTKNKPCRIFLDHHYWSILEISKNNNVHPTKVCRQNKGLLPSVGVMHAFKRKNPKFKNDYHAVLEGLPMQVKLMHKIYCPEFLDQIKKMKFERKTNAYIAESLGVCEVTIEKYTKKYSIKPPEKTTCGNGLHPYPGLNKPCNLCATERTRKKNGYMERSISKTIIIDRNCTKCNAEIQVSRLYGNRKTAYCEPCKKEKYYESQDKYRREKRPLLKNINKD